MSNSTVLLIIAVILSILVLAALLIYYKRFSPVKDELKNSSLPIIYAIAVKFIDPNFLDASFFEIYNDVLRKRAKNISQRLLTRYSSELYKSIKSSPYNLDYLSKATIGKSSEEKATFVAKAIIVATQIDPSNYFTRGLRLPGSVVSENYKDILRVLAIRNSDVKAMLTQRKEVETTDHIQQ